MHSSKVFLWIIAVLALGLALILALKATSIDEKDSSPRGVLVGRIDYYGC